MFMDTTLYLAVRSRLYDESPFSTFRDLRTTTVCRVTIYPSTVASIGSPPAREHLLSADRQKYKAQPSRSRDSRRWFRYVWRIYANVTWWMETTVTAVTWIRIGTPRLCMQYYNEQTVHRFRRMTCTRTV